MLLSSEDKMTWFSSWRKLFEGADDSLAGWTVFPQRVAVKVTFVIAMMAIGKIRVIVEVKVKGKVNVTATAEAL